MRAMDDRGHLATECRNPRSMTFDRLSIEEAVTLMNSEDVGVAPAVGACRAEIVRAIALVESAFRAGGRLLYVGAGTSGRLGVLDAAECPPTFLSDPVMVQGIIAGGRAAMFHSVEGAEDSFDGGVAALASCGVARHDVVFGIATGGTTPFVHGAIRAGLDVGASTVFLACVPTSQVPDEADVSIRVLTGPEVLTGSTRLKAGTATKMVLNMVSTIAMVRCGKVYENLMVDVNAGVNRKLTDRGIRILMAVTGGARETCAAVLKAANGHVKTALVSSMLGVGVEEASRLLEASCGRLSSIVDDEAARNQG